MEKNLQYLAIARALMAAAGTSIMAPTWISRSYRTPASSSSRFTSSITTAASRISSTQLTIGYMILIRPNADARRMARSWRRKTSLAERR